MSTKKELIEQLQSLEKDCQLCNEAITLNDFNQPIPNDHPYSEDSMEERDDQFFSLCEQIKLLKAKIAAMD